MADKLTVELTVEQVRKMRTAIYLVAPKEAADDVAQLADAYLELVEAARRVINYGPIEFRLNHTGAMNATQLGDRDGWIRVRDALRAALPPEKEPSR